MGIAAAAPLLLPEKLSFAITSTAVPLCADRKVLLPISIQATSSPKTKNAAENLAAYLQKISGAPFQVQTSVMGKSIRVGTADDFPEYKSTFGFSDALNNEDYLLRSDENGVAIIGATERGVEHAVWDFLYRLGYRQFFPGPNWEIIPSLNAIEANLNIREHPTFFWRSIFCDAPTWKPDWTLPQLKPYRAQLQQEWDHWAQANRMGGAITVNSQHSDRAVIASAKTEFAQHPEYFALVNGQRRNKASYLQFCYSNPAVQQILVNYALQFFAEHPEADCVSIEPGDTNKWCECDQCRAMGSPSDRIAKIANIVIKAVRAQYPQKFVSFYAYSNHSDPPTIKLEPGIIVPATTALTQGKIKSFDERLAGWRDAGALGGVRDYYSIFWFDNGTPHGSFAARVDEMPDKLSHYHQLGIRMFTTESNNAWGANGLGHYLTARLLWNIDDAKNADMLMDDFIDRCFGSARLPMKKFFGMLTGAYQTPVPIFDRHYVGELYRLLDEAYKSTFDSNVKKRLDDLTIHVRYLELYAHSQDIEFHDQDALNKSISDILRFSSAAYTTNMLMPNEMLSGKNAHQWAAKWDKLNYIVPDDLNMATALARYQPLWDSRQPYNQEQLQQFIHEGIANNPPWKPRWNVTLAKPVGPDNGKSTFRIKTFATASVNRALLYRPTDGTVKISFDKITEVITGRQLDVGYFSWQLSDDEGKVLLAGNIIDKNNPLIFNAAANKPYFLSMQLSAEVTVEGAAVALQTNLNRRRLHLYLQPQDLYLYVPQNVNQWQLELTSLAPGETIRADIFSPDGNKAGTAETGGTTRIRSITLHGQEGFWKIQAGKASTGTIYDYLLGFDKVLSPWVSLNPGMLLIVTEQNLT